MQMMYNSNEEVEGRSGGEWIVDNLALRDNVAIPNDTTDPFQIMLMDKGPHFVQSKFENGWVYKWQQRDVVIRNY